VKLEVLGDQKTLFPNMSETLKAAETLVKDGFKVMVDRKSTRLTPVTRRDLHSFPTRRSSDLVKLEVLGDQKTLFPNMSETLKAAETLVKDGFNVMVYCSDDPIAAKQLEEIGCVAVMPLASLIGSGMGILNPWNLQIIIDQAKVPIVVDAGVGTASDAAIAMELGCHGVLMNTAIATAKNPVMMASAMKKAVEAGREAFLAGRMPKKPYVASASSPTGGLIGKP